MSTLLGDARVRIRPDMAGFQKDAEASVNKAMKNVAKVAAATVAVGLAVAAKGMKDSIVAAEAASTANARLDKVLSNMGHTSGVASKRVQDFARELGNATGIMPTTIKDAQGVLATFEGVAKTADVAGGSFDRATAAAADMSATLGMDVSGAAMMLGKALNDPVQGVSALRRAGVQLTEQQAEQVKAFTAAGDAAAAQDIILKEVEKQVGGAAVATANASDKMKVAFANLKERVGTAALPAFEQFTDVAIKLADLVAPKLEAAVAVAAEAMAAGGQNVLDNWAQVEGGFEAFAAWVETEWPNVSAELSEVWDDLRDVLPDVLDVLDQVGPALARMGELAAIAFSVFRALPDDLQQGIILIGILTKSGIVGLGVMAVKAVAATVAWAGMTAATVRSTAAVVANKIALLASKAVYGAQFVAAATMAVGSLTLAWIRNTAAVVANKIAMVAGKAAFVALRAAMIAQTAVQWALNAAMQREPDWAGGDGDCGTDRRGRAALPEERNLPQAGADSVGRDQDRHQRGGGLVPRVCAADLGIGEGVHRERHERHEEDHRGGVEGDQLVRVHLHHDCESRRHYGVQRHQEQCGVGVERHQHSHQDGVGCHRGLRRVLCDAGVEDRAGGVGNHQGLRHRRDGAHTLCGVGGVGAHQGVVGTRHRVGARQDDFDHGLGAGQVLGGAGPHQGAVQWRG